ncbi:MAG: acyl-ACP thioesterase domain-containing protein [Cyclobacteriaceae bacterium]
MKSDGESLIGKKTYKVLSKETGLNQLIKFEALLIRMQEVAWENSVDLGFSVPDLNKRGLTWMVHRMQFEVLRYPVVDEVIEVRSWPSGQDRLYTYRDYKILDSQGKEIVKGTSAWLMIDIERRRPVSPVEVFDMTAVASAERMTLKKAKIFLSEQAKVTSKIIVGPEDIDLNDHVSNTRYVEWAMEVAREKFSDYKKSTFLDMIFTEESVLSDELIISTDERKSLGFSLAIKNQTKQSDAFRMTISI